MATIFDYVKWRGDISLRENPFNEVDNLVLSWLVYVSMEEIMPEGMVGEKVKLKDISRMFFEKNKLEDKLNTNNMTRTSALLLQEIQDSSRFGEMEVFNYINHISQEEQKQFCAMTVQINENSVGVVYRGTDDTIVGWREDFNMSFLPEVPAQKEALEYLEKTLQGRTDKVYIMGHSKGGNLSVYSAINASEDIKNRVVKVFNNDGPGFNKTIVQSENYQKMLPKIKVILPESSVVGMLFEHEGDYEVVMSNQKGLMQHDAGSWEVSRNQFVYLDSLSNASKFIDESLKQWIANQTEEERRAFVDGLFKLLESAGAKTTGELYELGVKNVTSAAKTLNGMDPELKKNLLKVSKLLIKIIGSNMTSSFKQSVKKDATQIISKNNSNN